MSFRLRESPVQHYRLVAEPRKFSRRVGDHHRGDSRFSLDAPYLVPEFQSERLVQGAQRFVQEQQVRVSGQSPRERRALPLSARKLAGEMGGVFGKAGQFEQFFRLAPVACSVRYVAEYGQVREKRVILKYKANTAFLRRKEKFRRAVVPSIFSVYDETIVGMFKSRQAAQQC